MFEKMSYTWQLMGASWEVLKRDKSLIVFPLLSAICCMLVMASFALPLWVTKSYMPPTHGAPTPQQVEYYAVVFAFYFTNYFVITFFNTGIVACAIKRMLGQEASVAEGFRSAFARIHLIVAWALFSATVGLVLKIISERSGKVGRIITDLLGMAWSLMTYLVVPVIVMENKGPIAAFRESSLLLTKTWGERLVGAFSFGTIFSLLMLPTFGLIILGVYLFVGVHQPILAVICMAVAVLLIIALSLVQSALQSIFQAAIYMYTQNALDTNAPAGQGFPVRLIQHAIAVK